jgi:hypothetical protein
LENAVLLVTKLCYDLASNFREFSKTYFMAKYSKKAQDKIEKVMHEKKRGTLRSGSGKKVTSRKQAIAIGISEARKAGAKVPKKKTSTSQRKKSSSM